MDTKYKNIKFRPFGEDDAESLALNADNINVWNGTGDRLPHPYTLKDAQQFIALCIDENPPVNFAIDVDGRAVGAIGYIPGQDVQRVSAEVGYWLGEPYWGQGITSRLVEQMSDYIFSNTEISHLFAKVFHFNIGSMKVLENAGFTKVGVMHSAAVKNGEAIDLHYYEKLKV